MARLGMPGVRELMVRPGRLAAVLDRLEKARARILGS
jgi:hypothetical protein